MAVKKTAIRKHTVKANLQILELTKAGSSMKLEIFADRQKLGEIEIGRGALYWKGNKRQLTRRISWSNFAAMMDQQAYGE